MENEYLKQEVTCLTKDLILVKGKMEQVQPHFIKFGDPSCLVH